MNATTYTVFHGGTLHGTGSYSGPGLSIGQALRDAADCAREVGGEPDIVADDTGRHVRFVDGAGWVEMPEEYDAAEITMADCRQDNALAVVADDGDELVDDEDEFADDEECEAEAAQRDAEQEGIDECRTALRDEQAAAFERGEEMDDDPNDPNDITGVDYEGYWNAVVGPDRSAESTVAEFGLVADGIEEWVSEAEMAAWLAGGNAAEDFPGEQWEGHRARLTEALRGAIDEYEDDEDDTIKTSIYSNPEGDSTLVVEWSGYEDDCDLGEAIDAAVRAEHPNIIRAWEALCDAGHAPVPDETALVRPGRGEWSI